MSTAHAQRVIEDARRICAVPAPTFAETARGELVAGMLADEGLAPETDAAGNVLAGLGEGRAQDTIVFAAHLDTVFPAGTEIAFVESAGRLAAPGIGDNSLGVAALLHLARHLGGRRLSRPVLLAATVGEEGLGDLRGAKALVAERTCGAFVAVEGDMIESLTVAATGSRRFRVELTGPGGHPWSDRGTPSAVHALLRPLAELVEDLQRTGLVVNVGVLSGGTAINVIAAQARAEVDIRSPDDAELERAARRVRDVFARLPDGVVADVQWLGHRPGGRVAPDHPLVQAARRARERAGLPPAPEEASSTDANAAHGRGIPAVTVGITTGGNVHRLDEYIDLEPIPAGLAALAALADELVGPPGPPGPPASPAPPAPPGR